DDEVTESNENDNARSFTVEVEGGGGGSDLPNLVVQSIDAPASVEAGTELRFDFVVAELNDPDDFRQLVSSVPFEMEYFLIDGNDRIKVGDRTNPTGTLWPFSREREYSGRADIPSGLSPGTYEIVVEVDTDDEVAESNENDNARSFTVRVEGGGSDLPNLVVQSIDAPASVEAGSQLSFDFVVAEVNNAPNFNEDVR
ncbi:MAG: CARDB domain-containing protein, partial [Bacteroidota bacterium]